MTLLPSDVSIVFEFCATGPGGGVDPTCSPDGEGGSGVKLQTAKGSKEWPEDVRKKLRALQSRLSRAKTVEAKAKVALAINALIAEQSGVKAPAVKAGLSAKEALLEAAKHVEMLKPANYGYKGYDDVENAWILNPNNEPSLFEGKYKFKTPSGRLFTIEVDNSQFDFFDDGYKQSTTGKGEAHFIFSEVAKATAALALKTDVPGLKFTAEGPSAGRKRLYSRLASSLASLIPGAKASESDSDFGKAYKVQLRPLPVGVKFAFCPTGPGGGVDPTCSPANAGSGATEAPVLAKAVGSKDWPDAAKKRLRALQSRLSRAKNAEAKALVIQSINALIKEQSGEKADAPVAVTAKPNTAAQQIEQDIKKLAVDTKLAAEVAKQGRDVAALASAPITSKEREQLNTLRWYTQSGFSVLNYGLRREPDNPEVMNSGDVRDRVKKLDAVLNKFKTPVDMVVHRAVGQTTQQKWIEGYIHTELGYSSTSATTVAGGKTWDKKVRCIVKVPKGTPGAYVKDVSAYPKEREYLLGRGLKYRVLARQEKVPKAEAKKLLFGDRTISDSALGHKEYTIIHMEVVQ